MTAKREGNDPVALGSSSPLLIQMDAGDGLGLSAIPATFAGDSAGGIV